MKKTITANKYNSLLNAAVKHQNTGHLTEALKIYSQLIEQNPQDSKLLFLLGSLHGQLGQLEKCIELLNLSLEQNDGHLDSYNNLAIAYELTGQLDHAIAVSEKALQLSPDSPQTLSNIGDLYIKKGNFKKALTHLNHSLKLSPDNESALLNKANLLGQTNQMAEAKKIYNHALNIFPDNIRLLSNFSALLQLEENFTKAEVLIRKAISINPNYPQALSNLGNLLIKKEKFIESEECLRKAIALNPQLTEAYINLGFLYHQMARLDEALIAFDKAVSLDPENSTGHWYRTFTRLLAGKFESAWKDYEYGLINGERVVGNYHYPPYNPDFQTGSQKINSLFVMAEQGIGDQIMFASCIPDVLNHTDNIILECEKRLVPLFRRSFPSVTVIHTGQYNYEALQSNFPMIQQKIAIGSLPHLFRNNLAAFPKNSPYLQADKNNYLKWKNRFSTLGKKLKVGISWQGGVKIEHDKRSMSLNSWKEVLQCDCDFINLQYGNHKAELNEIENKYNITIHDWDDSDSLLDIDDFSAQISALDLVISVGNTNVHLAGSLNIPALCLIPQVPSWRWLFSGNDCLWYPSVKIIRQKKRHDWSPVIQKAKHELEEMIEKNNSMTLEK